MSSRIASVRTLDSGDKEVTVTGDFTHTYHKFVCVVPAVVYNWEIETEVQLIKYVRKHGSKSVHKYKPR